MKWTTGLSRKPDTTPAFREASSRLDVASPAEVDLVLVFFSDNHTDNARDLALDMTRAFPNAVCVGCNAAGVVGVADHTDQESSLSVTAAVLPGVDLTPIRFEPDVHDRADFEWRGELGLDEGASPNFLVLSEASSFETEALLAALDRSFPEAAKFGGLVGTGAAAGNRLLLEGHVYTNGAVGLGLQGNLRVDTVVAQACRPIGEPLIVTEHTQNIIHRFDRGNPMEVFRDLVHSLEGAERELAQHSMFVGIGVENRRGEYGAGDFVIRNIIGFNPKNGDLAVAAPIDDLDVIQFHLMDPHTSTVTFEQAMGEFAAQVGPGGDSRGALLFSGIASGDSRSDKASQEADLLHEYLGGVPIGGFFAEGEIAPVGRKSCLHGYASTVTLIREA